MDAKQLIPEPINARIESLGPLDADRLEALRQVYSNPDQMRLLLARLSLEDVAEIAASFGGELPFGKALDNTRDYE